MKNQNLDAEKLYLASSNEKNENAQAILELSAEEEKYPFILQLLQMKREMLFQNLKGSDVSSNGIWNLHTV